MKHKVVMLIETDETVDSTTMLSLMAIRAEHFHPSVVILSSDIEPVEED